jgi:hypothetical protein
VSEIRTYETWIQKTPWRERLIFNVWRRPFPYLFHPWEVRCINGYVTGGSARKVCNWMKVWHEYFGENE